MFNKAQRSDAQPCRALMLALGAAMILRTMLVLYALHSFGPAWFFLRGSEMGFIGDSLAHGHGFSAPFGAATGPTAMVAPGYPLLVSFLFRFLGSYSWPAALSLMLIQTACNTFTVYLIFYLGRHLADIFSAAIVALFWACSLPLVWMPTIFWETSISCALAIGLISAMLPSSGVRPLKFWITCGALVGVTGLFNPALLPSALTLTMFSVIRTSSKRKQLIHVSAVLVSFGLVFSLWPIRNALTFHSLILTRSTIGLELWMGNHPGSTGFLDSGSFPTYNMAELRDYRRKGEIAYTREKGKLARTFIMAHPVRFGSLSVRRFFRFWMGTGTERGSVLFGWHAMLSSLLGFAGLALLWKRGDRHVASCISIMLVLFPLPYYITHAEFRYRLVIDPILCALAAPTLQHLLATRRLASAAAPRRSVAAI